MGEETQDVWCRGLIGLPNAEIAELAILDLFKSEPRHPAFAKFRETYEMVRSAIDREERTALPPAKPPDDDELEARRAIATRGREKIRKVLAEKGIALPIDEGHAGDYDPPLTVAEQRHRFHVVQDAPQPDVCRFCRETVAS